MKKTIIGFIGLFPLLFMSSWGIAADKAEIIAQIKKDFADTTENINNYQVKRLVITSRQVTPDTPYYSEGDTFDFYLENGKLRKIVFISRQSDGSKWINEYYVKRDNVYFILQTYVTEQHKTAYRYYFSPDGNLIRTIDATGVSDNKTEFDVMAGEMLGEFNTYRELLPQ